MEKAFYSEALILDVDVLVLRGLRECVERDYELLVYARKSRGASIEGLGIYYPLEYGLSREEVQVIVDYILNHSASGICSKYRVLMDNNDFEGLHSLVKYCRENT